MKKLIFTTVCLILLVVSPKGYSQSVNDLEHLYSSEHCFTVDDLYKWRNQMNFKPRYFNNISQFDNLILKMKWEACRQWYIELDVAWEGYREDKNNSHWFVFKSKLNEFYGNLPQDYIEKWYIPLFVFLELDKWAYQKSDGQGLGVKDHDEKSFKQFSCYHYEIAKQNPKTNAVQTISKGDCNKTVTITDGVVKLVDNKNHITEVYQISGKGEESKSQNGESMVEFTAVDGKNRHYTLFISESGIGILSASLSKMTRYF